MYYLLIILGETVINNNLFKWKKEYGMWLWFEFDIRIELNLPDKLVRIVLILLEKKNVEGRPNIE